MSESWSFQHLDDEFFSLSPEELQHDSHSNHFDILDFDFDLPLSQSPEDSMPATTRRAAQAAGTEIVDLTEDPPTSAQPVSQADERRSSKQEEAATKKTQGRKRKRDEEPRLEKAESIEEAVQTPRQPEEGNTRIGQMTCIICMDSFTNAATGQCGHMFCHECLTRALMASERQHDRGSGSCPTCRKAIFRNKKNSAQVIPINFMKKSTYKSKYQKT